MAVAATERKHQVLQGSVKAALASACGLLGVAGQPAEATEVRTAVLGYSEQDRVQAFEAIIDATHEFGGGKIGNLHVVYDALSGASPNGAVPSQALQSFTRPSGNGVYTAAPGETPLDDTFWDTRMAVSGSLTFPLDRVTGLTAGLYGSGEHDYSSLGANLALTRDFNRRNTTVSLRAGYFDDAINPEGGRPAPFGVMLDQALSLRLDGDGSKQTLDLGAGLTQVIDRRTLVGLNYTFSQVDGYQTDPYKLVSVVDGISGDPLEQLYESRPDARAKHALLAKLVRQIGDHNLHLSYRFFTDDWGVRSQTVDLRFRWNAGPALYVQPRLRYYHQGEADFYRRYLLEGEALPQHASADYRLGALDDYTPGLEVGITRNNGHLITVRAEYFLQTGESHPAGVVGQLADQDLFPTVKALMVQVGYAVGL